MSEQALPAKQRKTTTMKHMHTIAAALLLASMLLAGCKGDRHDELVSPAPVNEEELITDAYLLFRDDAGNAYAWHAAQDDGFHHDHGDGDGHGTGEGGLHLHADTLPAGTLMHVEIILLNTSVSPVDTVSHEVLDEGSTHQFFFHAEDVDISFAYADQDGDGRPIGLRSSWAIGAAGTGEVQVVLRHGPDKGAPGVSQGDITNAGGSTDLEVHFPAVVQ